MTQNYCKRRLADGASVEVVNLEDKWVQDSVPSPRVEPQENEIYDILENLPPFLRNDSQFLGIKTQVLQGNTSECTQSAIDNEKTNFIQAPLECSNCQLFKQSWESEVKIPKEDIMILHKEIHSLKRQNRLTIENHGLEVSDLNQKLKVVQGKVTMSNSRVNIIIATDPKAFQIPNDMPVKL